MLKTYDILIVSLICIRCQLLYSKHTFSGHWTVFPVIIDNIVPHMEACPWTADLRPATHSLCGPRSPVARRFSHCPNPLTGHMELVAGFPLVLFLNCHHPKYFKINIIIIWLWALWWFSLLSAPIGAQGLTICVCLFVSNLSRAVNLHHSGSNCQAISQK